MTPVTRFALLSVFSALATASEVTLAAPLTTLVPLPSDLPALTPGAGRRLSATITVPPDAPADIGVGGYLRDRDGTWWQCLQPEPLRPGRNRVSLALRDGAQVSGPAAGWNPAVAATTFRGGLFLWSASASRCQVQVDGLTVAELAASDAAPALTDLHTDGPAVASGERWALHLRPQPFPSQPYDAKQFNLTLVVSRPDGREERITGFYDQPMRAHDRGDREEVVPQGQAGFTVRYRPRMPGTHHLRLEAAWADTSVATALPDLAVSGATVDPYVRIDTKDPRFFSLDGACYWPIGPNLRSVSDPRSQEHLDTAPTPLRGTLAYDAYFDRLAANGVNTVEIWLSSWNLGLEWNGRWPGYRGLGRYHEGHAWQLDRILDAALAHGIRVNLAINNHGQASGWVDSEWRNNPFNRANGGPFSSPEDLFTSERAKALQDQVRRYLVARYADHPAIMAWKLWTEVEFVGEERRRYQMEPVLAAWHEQAARRWQDLDVYGHPVTSHWSSNWTRVHPQVAALPQLGFLCFNAYHNPPGQSEGVMLADLMRASVAKRALGQYHKPLLCTEFGGQFDACPEPQMEAEHASGPFCGLVCGLAGAPMLWWYEWVDQGNRFGPYRAIRAFTAGEDLRDPRGLTTPLQLATDEVWAQAWARPGRLLGYLVDREWQTHGLAAPEHPPTAITIGAQVAAGAMTIAWWDADRGCQLSASDFQHAGGELVVTSPAWRRHLAFKLLRR
jgi:hypothetical protein